MTELTQREKAERFRKLHEGRAFVMPNPWDGGSARVLAGLGFQALATSLYRAAMSGMIAAATEVKEQGTFSYLGRSATKPDFYSYLKS